MPVSGWRRGAPRIHHRDFCSPFEFAVGSRVMSLHPRSLFSGLSRSRRRFLSYPALHRLLGRSTADQNHREVVEGVLREIDVDVSWVIQPPSSCRPLYPSSSSVALREDLALLRFLLVLLPWR